MRVKGIIGGVRFCVITAINSIDGNSSCIYLQQSPDKVIYVGLSGKESEDWPFFARGRDVRDQVFEVSEILMVDRDGREIAFPGRKPDKWDVEYTMFDTLSDALACSRQLSQGE